MKLVRSYWRRWTHHVGNRETLSIGVLSSTYRHHDELELGFVSRSWLSGSLYVYLPLFFHFYWTRREINLLRRWPCHRRVSSGYPEWHHGNPVWRTSDRWRRRTSLSGHPYGKYPIRILNHHFLININAARLACRNWASKMLISIRLYQSLL